MTHSQRLHYLSHCPQSDLQFALHAITMKTNPISCATPAQFLGLCQMAREGKLELYGMKQGKTNGQWVVRVGYGKVRQESLI